jgi:hypothetical protein
MTRNYATRAFEYAYLTIVVAASAKLIAVVIFKDRLMWPLVSTIIPIWQFRHTTRTRPKILSGINVFWWTR